VRLSSAKSLSSAAKAGISTPSTGQRGSDAQSQLSPAVVFSDDGGKTLYSPVSPVTIDCKALSQQGPTEPWHYSTPEPADEIPDYGLMAAVGNKNLLSTVWDSFEDLWDSGPPSQEPPCRGDSEMSGLEEAAFFGKCASMYINEVFEVSILVHLCAIVEILIY
jgi:hypothetical protein